jgi:hypothetical protein
MEKRNFDVSPNNYELIANLIGSDASPVGIDAKKTHIIVLNKLQELCERMERIEQKLVSQK